MAHHHKASLSGPVRSPLRLPAGCLSMCLRLEPLFSVLCLSAVGQCHSFLGGSAGVPAALLPGRPGPLQSPEEGPGEETDLPKERGCLLLLSPSLHLSFVKQYTRAHYFSVLYFLFHPSCVVHGVPCFFYLIFLLSFILSPLLPSCQWCCSVLSHTHPPSQAHEHRSDSS